MDSNSEKILKELSPKKIVVPIIIGLGVFLYMIASDKNLNYQLISESLSHLDLWWVSMAFFVLFCRDFGYIFRIRMLTSSQLSWKSAFYIVMLWEFASAITPSVVGGTTVASFIINKEGISLGKALSYVMLTAVLDNLFFVVASISAILLFPGQIFPKDNDYTLELLGYVLDFREIFMVSIGLIFVYTLFMAWGLFVGPRAFKRILAGLTANKLLRRWHKGAIHMGNEMIVASKELGAHPITYWLTAITSTLIVWIARYLMLNCLINAFTHTPFFAIMSPQQLLEQGVMLSRQVVMWVIMLISPTPGSAGTAEYFFGEFFKDFLKGGTVLVVAILWRLLTYYAYLFMGVFVLPKWVHRVFNSNRSSQVLP